MRKRSRLIVAFGILASSVILTASVAAQSFPSRAVRLIVPLVPGGSTDTLARLVAQKLSEKWGQPVLVINKPGGSMILGAQEIIRSRPDGYTLLLAVNSMLTINPALFDKPPYDALNDFTHITKLTDIPGGMFVGRATGIRSVTELIDRAKAQPESITYGISDQSNHLAVALFSKIARVQLKPVMYKGGADASRALLSGEVQLGYNSVFSALQFVKSGEFRALATGGKHRARALPDVPTLEEAGIANFEANVWIGLSAPAGLPREIVDKINADVVAVFQIPDVREKLLALGMEPVSSSPEAYVESIQGESARLKPLIKELGLKLE